MDYTYCFKYCERGKIEANKILADSESISDAAIDFSYFVEECFNTCPCKNKVLAAINKGKEN